METIHEVVADALRTFDSADLEIIMSRADEPLIGFFGRLAGVEPIDDEDGDLALEFAAIDGDCAVGGVTVPALADAEWRDVGHHDGAGEALPPIERCLALDVGANLEVLLCRRSP